MLGDLDAGESFGELIKELYDKILESRGTIATLEAELAERRGLAICQACSTINPGENKFCGECGAKIEAVKPVADEEPASKE